MPLLPVPQLLPAWVVGVEDCRCIASYCCSALKKQSPLPVVAAPPVLVLPMAARRACVAPLFFSLRMIAVAAVTCCWLTGMKEVAAPPQSPSAAHSGTSCRCLFLRRCWDGAGFCWGWIIAGGICSAAAAARASRPSRASEAGEARKSA